MFSSKRFNKNVNTCSTNMGSLYTRNVNFGSSFDMASNAYDHIEIAPKQETILQ
jgi:hypothetical protein